ncbi:MAG: hypothetical protein GY856_08850 [bacterium]|nr:hypothetical protein [bacterium]
MKGIQPNHPTPIPASAPVEPDISSHFDNLRTQMILESIAMAKHAFASGIKVPGQLVLAIQQFVEPRPREQGGGEDASEASGDESPPLKDLVPSADPPGVTINLLARVHEQLARIVAPATPRTILLIAKEQQKKGFWLFLGPVPLVRGLMLAAVVFLVGLVCISLSEQVNGQVSWSTESGWSLLLEELFLISAAGLGAAFTALFQANRYIVDGVFDPKYDASYWIRIVLGVIAGMILALLIPIEGSGSLKELTKPTLAMLGGFSVAVVYRILNRMVVAVESLVQGDSKDQVKSEVKAAQVRAEEEQGDNRLRLAAGLMSLKEQIGTEAKPEQIHQKLRQILGQLVPMDEEESVIAEASGSAGSAPPDSAPPADSGKPDALG